MKPLLFFLNEWKDQSIHRWPDVTPQIALSSKGKVPNRKQTNISIQPNNFHSKYVCFNGRKTLEERKNCPKIRLFGCLQRLVMRSAITAPRKVLLSSTLIGQLEFERERPLNSSLWKRVIAWGRSRAASTYGIIWEDAGQNKHGEIKCGIS